LRTDGGVVSNRGTGGARATISGGTTGVVFALNTGTVKNFGTIIGAGGTAVQFFGHGEVIVGPGAKFLGAAGKAGVVDGGRGSTLELAARSSGTLPLGTQFVHFSTVTVDSGANWRVDARLTSLAGETIAGAGTNVLALTSAGTFDLSGVSGFSRIAITNSGTNAVTLRDANFTKVAGGRITIDGGNGNDTLSASLAAGHKLALDGGAGKDTFALSLSTLAISRVEGGLGADTLAPTAAGTVSAAGVSGVETYVLANGAANALTLKNANFAGVGGSVITIDGGNNGNTVNAAALTGANRVIVVGGFGTDLFTGGASNDVFKFSTLAATDAVKGGAGTDKLLMTNAGGIAANGVAGVEIFSLANGGSNSLTLGNTNFTGVAGHTITVFGGDSTDILSEAGVAAADKAVLRGGAGDDMLMAGQQAILTGGAGADVFGFATPGTPASPDRNTITDFTHGVDRIGFNDAGFGVLGTLPRPVTAAQFSSRSNGTFDTADERFAYDSGAGVLYFDADGSGAGSSRQRIATLTGHPTVTASDLFFLFRF
jgi:hypothetical protein